MDFFPTEIYLTMEDILILHRGYITKLYVEDGMSVVEIVEQLYLCHLRVSITEIEKCISDWKLVQPPRSSPPNNFSSTSAYITSRFLERYENPPATVPRSFEPSDYRDTYANRSLSDPPPASQTHSSPKQQTISATTTTPPRHVSTSPSSKERLKLTCHHGTLPSEYHEVSSTLDTLPTSGPSPLETYADTEEAHEMRAVGLVGETSRSRNQEEARVDEAEVDKEFELDFRRATDLVRDPGVVRVTTKARTLSRITKRKRRDDPA